MKIHDISTSFYDARKFAALANGTIYITSIEQASEYCQDLDFLRFNGTTSVTIIITSPGGSISAGLSIIDAIRSLQREGAKVTGVVRGEAQSMGFNILQACDTRIMSQGSILMAHGVTSGMLGDQKEHEAAQKLLKYWREHIAAMIALRVKTFHIGKETFYNEITSIEYWDKLMKDSTPVFYTPYEALELGLVDQVA